MKKIAFCFLIYDNIINEELWDIFFKNVDKDRYNIYIHYKINNPLKFFEKYKLKDTVETRYAHVSIVRAQNMLLKEALKDKDNQHFIFLSDSCLPLKCFGYIFNLLDKTKSYFNICPQKQCFPRCNNLLNDIKKEYIQKASQWCILNRKHSELMVKDESYLELYENIAAPDEHCYITNIFINNLQNELITTPNIADGATTFTNWEGMDYKYPSIHDLKNYTNILDEELTYLTESKSLFGRKFLRGCFSTFLNNEQYIVTISV